jgi:hypothetical protein
MIKKVQFFLFFLIFIYLAGKTDKMFRAKARSEISVLHGLQPVVNGFWASARGD